MLFADGAQCFGKLGRIAQEREREEREEGKENLGQCVCRERRGRAGERTDQGFPPFYHRRVEWKGETKNRESERGHFDLGTIAELRRRRRKAVKNQEGGR